MDFAKKQLEKYGWEEGKGLGKQEHGITAAIKPKLKFDTAGIGHNISDQFTDNWWESLYNAASNSFNVNTSSNGMNDGDTVELATKGYSVNPKNKSVSLEYGTFLKTSKLTGNGLVDLDNNNLSSTEDLAIPKVENRPLTDEELFIACGGRTAHKGARHGLTLNGKLSRLEKQEKLLLKKLRKVSLSDESDDKTAKGHVEKKLKKIDNHKVKYKKNLEDDTTHLSALIQGLEDEITATKGSKKRKKERKRVSFNETATEYQNQDPDSNGAEFSQFECDLTIQQNDGSSPPSIPIVTIRHVKIKGVNENIPNDADMIVPDQDEGICSDYDCTKEKDINDLQAKIKKYNKKMKRKLMKLRKNGNSFPSDSPLETSQETLEVSDTASNDEIENYNKKCVKRKINLLQEDNVGRTKRNKDESANETNLVPYLTKSERKKERKERHLEKRINKVAESLNQICKISADESK